MLDHVSITVDDLAAAERFYDAVFAALGVAKVGASETWIGYGERCDAENPGRAYLSIRSSTAPCPAPARHWCFKAPTRKAVDRFWHDGLRAGGCDQGEPGLREHYHPDYYAAFLADPSGNRVEAVCHLALP